MIMLMSVLVGLQALLGSAALADVFPSKYVGLAVVAVSAVQTGVTYYLRGTRDEVRRVRREIAVEKNGGPTTYRK